MRTRILATWAIGILGILLGRPVCAATAVVLYEPQRPAIAFGANDLVEALRQKRIVVETADPGALTTKKAAIQVAITTTDARVGVEQRPNGFPHAVPRSVVGRIVSQPVPAGLLAGIGITAGENMEDLDNAGKERRLWDTYGTQGIGYPDAPSARSSRAIRQVRERIERVAVTDFTILIEGGIGPQLHPNFINLFREAPFGDRHGQVAGAGEDRKR